MSIMEKCPECWAYMIQKIKYGIDGNPYVEYTCPKCGKKISALQNVKYSDRTPLDSVGEHFTNVGNILRKYIKEN